MSSKPDTDTPADVITSVGAGSLVEARERAEELGRKHLVKRALGKAVKRVERRIRELDAEVQEDFAELGTSTRGIDLGTRKGRHTLSLNAELRGSPRKTGIDDDGEPTATDEDWERACDALVAAGQGHLVQRRFNHNSLSAWLKEMRDTHGPEWRDEVPDELLDALEIREGYKVGMRKAGAK